MKQFFSRMKRILALLIVFGMVAGLVPAPVLAGMGAVVAGAVEPESGYELNNGYIKVTVSEKTGGFGIRTVEGDKVNKSDNDKYLVFEYDEDNTSFTSFQVTWDGQTKEYIFGGKYPGSSGVSVSKTDSEITAAWSVDGLTFKQIITLENSGSTEHGAVLISYAAENSGAPAAVKCRILMDTALGYQDYAYYRVGKTDHEREIALGEDGYDRKLVSLGEVGHDTVGFLRRDTAVDEQSEGAESGRLFQIVLDELGPAATFLMAAAGVAVAGKVSEAEAVGLHFEKVHGTGLAGFRTHLGQLLAAGKGVDEGGLAHIGTACQSYLRPVVNIGLELIKRVQGSQKFQSRGRTKFFFGIGVDHGVLVS